VNLCNAELGTPFDRCMVSFTEASKDCAEQVGPTFAWTCNVVDVFQKFCYFAKAVDVFCWLPSLVKEAVFEPLKGRKHSELNRSIVGIVFKNA
jgi:hypothetical protein